MDVKIETSWKEQLNEEFEKEYFEQLTHFVRDQYKTTTVFPPAKLIFNAFEHTPFDEVKVVILGQDPYHNIGQAHGLSFSVNDGVRTPPSLVNIFKEINTDLNIPISSSGNLIRWADQGVLLLNATLTVEAHKPGSHQNKGWEKFTDAAIRILSDRRQNVVFLLWGAYAQKKAELIDSQKHLVLKAAHPSPLARGAFFGNKHFSQTNDYLSSRGIDTISW